MKSLRITLVLALLSLSYATAGEIDPSQQPWLAKYQKQKNAPKPEEMLLNTDPEPELKNGFEDLVKDNTLGNWVVKGGKSKFTTKGGVVIGVCIPGEASTYLSTKKDYSDFIFTCEMKWEVDINSGIMFRAKSGEKHAVYGPQVEMEGIENTRGWSGGIYGQSCGGYWYPLWLKAHAEARKALNKEGWNRVTIYARGNTVKTWVNGVPAAHWVGDGTFRKGYFGLQIHHAPKGKVLWRGIRVKELTGKEPAPSTSPPPPARSGTPGSRRGPRADRW